MNEAALDVLLAARILERGPSGELRLGDQDGLLVPAEVDRLGRLAGDLLPPDVTGIVIGETRLDALLGYMVGRTRELPVVLMYDREGIGGLRGSLPPTGELCLLTGVLQDPWMVDEFEGLCRQHGVAAAGAAALVSVLSPADPRVRALVQI